MAVITAVHVHNTRRYTSKIHGNRMPATAMVASQKYPSGQAESRASSVAYSDPFPDPISIEEIRVRIFRRNPRMEVQVHMRAVTCELVTTDRRMTGIFTCQR